MDALAFSAGSCVLVVQIHQKNQRQHEADSADHPSAGTDCRTQYAQFTLNAHV